MPVRTESCFLTSLKLSHHPGLAIPGRILLILTKSTGKTRESAYKCRQCGVLHGSDKSLNIGATCRKDHYCFMHFRR